MKKQTLPKVKRLNKMRNSREEFRNQGKIVSSSYVIIYKRNNLTHPRLGIIVAKHNVKLAVMRNQIKRIVRESFRQQQALLSNNDYIVILKQLKPAFDKQQLRSEINKQWQLLKKSFPN